jgi:hypothetical protein
MSQAAYRDTALAQDMQHASAPACAVDRYETVEFEGGYLQLSWSDVPQGLKPIFSDLFAKAKSDQTSSHYHDLPDGSRVGVVYDRQNQDIRFWLWNKDFVAHSAQCTTAAKVIAGYNGKAEIFFGHIKR